MKGVREFKNAIIKSVKLDTGDRGLLTAWLFLDYGGSEQGFGGYALYLPKDWKHHSVNGDFAGHFIFRSMQVAGVEEWSKLPGKTVRAVIEDGLVSGIGHIVKDDWFYPSSDFEKMKQANEKP